MAVCVSVTSALWEAEAGGFLRSLPMSSIPGLTRVSVIGIKWGIIEQDTGHMCSVDACSTPPHTHNTPSFTHRNVQMNFSQCTVQWEDHCSECLRISRHLFCDAAFPSSDPGPPHTDVIPVPVPISTSCIANTSYTFCISLYYLSHLHIFSLYVCLYKHKLPHIKGVSSVLLSRGCQGLNSAHQVYLMSQRRSQIAAKFLNLFVFICITFINLGEGSIACTVGYLCRSKESLLVLLWAPAVEVKSCLETVVCTH